MHLRILLEAFASPLSGIACYVAVRLIRRSQGMSFGQTFAEIAPE